jgi:rubredoxin
MRLHGNAQISARSPRALAVCNRCGFLYNRDRLTSQWDWQQGPRLKDLHLWVCPSCYDKPQESGRTVVLPPDPVPVKLAFPESYVGADNPVGGLGYNPRDNFIPGSSLGANIGNMVNNAGVDAAFTLNGQSSVFNSTSVTGLFAPQTAPLVNKRMAFCAALMVSNSSFQNTVGKNWNGYPSGITTTLPSTVSAVTHTVSGFTAQAPNDQAFLRTGATGWIFQGSADSVNWTTLSSGTTAGTVAETLAVSGVSGAAYQYHQFALQGDGISAVGIAGLSISISDAAPNDI